MSDVTVYAEALIAAVARGKRGSDPIPMYNSEDGYSCAPLLLCCFPRHNERFTCFSLIYSFYHFSSSSRSLLWRRRGLPYWCVATW